MTISATSPLSFTPPLRLAIVGRKGAGKSTLIQSLLRHAPVQPPPPPTNPPVQRPTAPILIRFLRSPISSLIRQTLRTLSHLARGAIRNAHCAEHSFRPRANSPPLTIWDATGESGIAAVANETACDVDVVLFVTRLDDSRVSSSDRLQLTALVWLFGKHVLDKTVVVLTHGCSLPPVNLSFADFVRGRSDLFMRYVDALFPPEKIDVGETESVDGTGIDWSDGEDGEFFKRDDFGFNAQKEDPDEGESTVDIVQDPVDVLYKQLKRVTACNFKEGARLPVVVVEQSDACPVNGEGFKILPDGQAWLPALVETVSKVATRSREAVVMNERELAVRTVPREDANLRRGGKFWERFTSMVRSFAKDGIRVMWAEFAVLLLGVQLFASAESGRRRRRLESADDGDDVVLDMSDEDWERITKPDPPSVPDDEDDIDPEEAFFGQGNRLNDDEEEDTSMEEYDARNIAKLNEKLNGSGSAYLEEEDKTVQSEGKGEN